MPTSPALRPAHSRGTIASRRTDRPFLEADSTHTGRFKTERVVSSQQACGIKGARQGLPLFWKHWVAREGRHCGLPVWLGRCHAPGPHGLPFMAVCTGSRHPVAGANITTNQVHTQHLYPSSPMTSQVSPSNFFKQKPGDKREKAWEKVVLFGEPGPYQLSVQEALVERLGFCPDGPPATPPASVPVTSAAQHPSLFKTLLHHQAPQEVELTPKPHSS